MMRRSDLLGQLGDDDSEWDLVVIGGGASGLGIALDAAARGYKIALLEQADFSEGTSSRSTKLIHGGVRYLRGGEISLVRESLHERGRLLRNAPNLVEPLSFVVPAYRFYERFFYGSGLVLYDFLAGKLGIESTQHLSRQRTKEQIPNLSGTGLRGSTLYWDGQFDDARLAVAIAQTAVREGATVLNHVRVQDLLKEGSRVRGVVATDQLSGTEYRLKAKVVVNATGVFTDSIRKMDEPEAAEVIMPSQGIHIVLDHSFLGGNTGVMIPKTDDGRVLFAIPWQNRVLLGTTDTGEVPVELNPKPQDEEVDYLLEHASRYLEKAPTHTNIRATFAGLRPLVRPPTATGATSKISRNHSIFVSDSGLLTIAGGKWTTFRKMAEDAVDRAIEVGSLETQPCCTSDLTLLDEGSAGHWLAEDPSLAEPLDEALSYTMADIAAAVRDEMAMTLRDALHRRTRCAFLDREATSRCAEKCAAFMAKELSFDQHWIDSQIKSLTEP